MNPHAWRIESVDCGHLGVNDFWTCDVCGAAGGIALPGDGSPRHAGFIPSHEGGVPPINVSEDCTEALAFIRGRAEERVRVLSKMGDKGISPHYASLLRDAMAWTPEITNVMPILGLVGRIVEFQGRPAFMEVRTELQNLGFRLVPREVSEALGKWRVR